MPRLALGRAHNGQDYLLHCDARWNVKGVGGGYPGVRAAKERAERFYPGFSKALGANRVHRKAIQAPFSASGLDPEVFDLLTAGL